jgi:membrane-bound ClpP family serine protease
VACVLLALAAIVGFLSGQWREWLPATSAADGPVQPPTEAVVKDDARPAFRVDVPLPIADSVDTLVMGRIDRVLRTLPKNGPRAVLVLEFRPREGAEGANAQASDFARSLSLARYLSGDRLSHVQTVAFLPATVKGHAVLPVLACEQIIVARDASLGAAGINETEIDAILRRGYSEIADRRRTVPAAVAIGLLDKNVGVFKVTTPDGVRFELADDLPALRAAGKVIKEDPLFREGDEHLLTGRELRTLGFASHNADDLRTLAAALQLPTAALQGGLEPEEGWRPLLIDLLGPIHNQQVNFALRNLQDAQQRDDFNLLILRIDSGGGSLEQSLRLAQAIVELPAKYHSVALVQRQARRDAALVAWACDEIVLTEGAMLGGPGESERNGLLVDELREPLKLLAQEKGADWSLPLALVDPAVEVYRYSRAATGEVRFLSEEEATTLVDPEAWQRDPKPLGTQRGLAADDALEVGLAKHVVRDLQDLKNVYQLKGDLHAARPNWALAAVEWLADSRIAGLLLFVAWFALMIEMSSPGVGVPGFLAALCFLLYFWSQFLHGTAGWLEVLLFLGGFACLAVEFFVLPGMGVFGLGGGMMILASIILASQTFVVPQNAYQLRQLPASLFVLAAGMTGAVVSIFVIQRFLPETPYLNRMLLRPPQGEEALELSRRESLVEWSHLAGKRGMTMTQLTPSGKAQFGDELVDVIADGELIERGTPVHVVEVIGNRVVVRRVG